MGKTCRRHGAIQKCIPEGKTTLETPRRRWEDNIKMDLRELGCDPRDWIALVEAGLRKGGNEPPGSLKVN